MYSGDPERERETEARAASNGHVNDAVKNAMKENVRRGKSDLRLGAP